MYLLYFLLWIIFNGNFTLEICVFGLIIAAVLLAFSCKFTDHSLAREREIYKKFPLFTGYCCVLIREIVKANFGAIHMILTQKEEIEPVLVSFHSNLKTRMGKALLANAITLTPGTITVTLEDAEYKVHCLDELMAEGLDRTVFETYIRKMEGESSRLR